MAKDDAKTKKGGLTGMFNSITIGGILKFTLQTLVIGLLVGGVMDFTLFHDHELGKAILGWAREPLLTMYDGISNTIGRPDLARDFTKVVSASPEKAAEAGITTDVAESVGECITLGPMGPVPCAG